MSMERPAYSHTTIKFKYFNLIFVFSVDTKYGFYTCFKCSKVIHPVNILREKHYVVSCTNCCSHLKASRCTLLAYILCAHSKCMTDLHSPPSFCILIALIAENPSSQKCYSVLFGTLKVFIASFASLSLLTK